MSGEQGRLIINRTGESAKAIQVLRGTGIRLQCNALLYFINTQKGMITAEVEFAPREAVALALQILDAAGYAAEAHPREGNWPAVFHNKERPARETALALSHTEQLKGKRP